MDLLSCILILGKWYMWTCRCKEIKQCLSHFKTKFDILNQSEKFIPLKLNNLNLFKEIWKMLEGINFGL